jgi:hypothetical protein
MSSLLYAYAAFYTPVAIVGSSIDSYKANNVVTGTTPGFKASVDAHLSSQSFFRPDLALN